MEVERFDPSSKLEPDSYHEPVRIVGEDIVRKRFYGWRFIRLGAWVMIVLLVAWLLGATGIVST